MKTFKEFLTEAVGAKISLEQYSWGDLRKVEVGNKFTVIIHPENWQQITSSDSGKFKDEQKITWSFNKEGDMITFKATGANRASITVAMSDLKSPKITKNYK